MHKNNIAYLVALTMLAATVPMTSADPGSYDHFEDAQGPAGIYTKDRALAIAFCFLNETMPASCDPQPGSIPAVGGAFFDVTSWNPNTDYGRAVRINAEQIAGQVVGGFAIHACTDYDDDIECDSGDWAQSDDVCGNTKEGYDKDKKNCADPTDTGLIFCAERDDYWYTEVHTGPPTVVHTHYDGDYDDFVVFVTSWVDVADHDAGGTGHLWNPKDTTGAGLSFGQFRIYADWTNQAGFVDKATCDNLNRYDQVNGAETGVVVEHINQCEDGIDNDGDGATDGDDPECTGPDDDNEFA